MQLIFFLNQENTANSFFTNTSEDLDKMYNLLEKV